MEIINWDDYGMGNYEKCVDCMVYCGYELIVVVDVVKNFLKVFWVSFWGLKIEGEMVLEFLLVD